MDRTRGAGESPTASGEIGPLAHELIEARALTSPSATAVVCNGATLTYRELNRRANQLAHHLRLHGVRPETLVGLMLPRSIDLVVGILGILKAGGGFVPLDPAYPADRVAFILNDAKARHVIAEENLLDVLPPEKRKVTCPGLDWAEISRQPDASPARTASDENLAYVMYTSGSTGRPKGVMITCGNLGHFARICGAALEVRSTDVYLHTASMAYALSIRQLFAPLCSGATMVMATAEQARDPIVLFDLVKRSRVSLMDVVPSFWRTCILRLSDLPKAELESLMDNSVRRIVSVGEPLSSDIPREWRARFGRRTDLVNIFGQTETTGVVASYRIPDHVRDEGRILPIGRSVPQTTLHILDSTLQPVVPGETGELFVSGPCLARGYLRRPELTAEKFINHRIDGSACERLYRTGDMARVREDGSIEFRGRQDSQVKVRGQRLELGEVEAVLREHPGVRDCVAAARGDQPDETHLVAYVVMTPGQEPDRHELSEFMRTRVPDYMIPARFIVLDTLPLTPGGKIDRVALPDQSSPATVRRGEVSSDRKRSDKQASELEGRTEVILTGIWRALLKADGVSHHRSFFELGGDSLLAVRMFSCIERELGVRLPLASLLEAPTIAALAELIDQRVRTAGQWSSVVPIRVGGRRRPFFGIHGHEGGVLFWRHVVARLPEDQPFYAVQAQGVDGIRPALSSIPDMATRYLKEMREVQPNGPYYLGGYSMGGEIALEVSQQLLQQGETVDLLIMFDTRAPDIGDPSGSDAEPTPRVGALAVLRRKVHRHVRRWKKLGFWGRSLYGLREVLHRLKTALVFGVTGVFQRTNRRVPDALLLRYLRESHSRALHRYVARFYPGRITLFRATQTASDDPADSSRAWRALAGGGLEIHMFDATHNLLAARYAREVAGKLNECLAKARRRGSLNDPHADLSRTVRVLPVSDRSSTSA